MNALEGGIYQFFIYSHRYENLSANEQHITENVAELAEHDEKNVEMLKNILIEVLKYMARQYLYILDRFPATITRHILDTGV